MTQPSSFPPDVLAVAAIAAREWPMREITEVIATAIMTDRMGRTARPVGGLTAHQKRVLGYLHAYAAEHGICPSFEEIRQYLGLASKSSVHRVIHELEGRGAIRLLPNRSRAITLISQPT